MQNADQTSNPFKISDGEEESQVKANLEKLIENGWDLSDGQLLTKTFYFKTYTKVLV
jgi:pterin-4a-carbinolamine dehydratase